MYLFTELRIIPLLLLFLLWGIGGWLMTLRWFDLEPHERGFIGFGLGLVVANWIGNFVARLLPLSMAFWIAALLTLGLGLFSAWPLRREWFVPVAKLQWGKWLLFVGAVLVFTLIGRGLGMLDDFQNLPLSSLMATGDLPPHFPGRPDTRFGYHYFLILLSVQLMRVASAGPWTALDLARGLALALPMAFTGFLAWRLTHHRTVAWIATFFAGFAGGTRWLLLLLPGSVLNRISGELTLIGSGRATADNLVDALSSSWQVAGSGPIEFPFAFVNGITSPALMAHNGFGGSAGLILLLLFLLAGRQRAWQAGIPFVILIASIALANEANFALLYVGIVLIAVLWIIQNRSIRPPRSAWFWIAVFILAGIFVLIQGGYISEVVYEHLRPSTGESDSYFEGGFVIVPPTVISSHLGKLSLFNPIQFFVALIEMGPIILVLPLALRWGYQAFREEQWFQAAMIASAIPSLLSIFLEYRGNAGVTATTRLFSNMFFGCGALGVALVWCWLQNQPEWKRNLTYGLGVMTILSGVVLFAIELIAIPHPVYSEFLTDMDARFYDEYWDRLEPASAWVFDPESSRGMTLFGRQTNANVVWGVEAPAFTAFVENPDPYQLYAAGYRYIYADKEYWKQYPVQLDQPCVNVLKTVDGAKLSHGELVPDFRRLADISACK